MQAAGTAVSAAAREGRGRGLGLHSLERVEESAAAVRERYRATPDVAIILGTGLGGVAERIEKPTVVEYADIPHFPLSTVESHVGRLLCGSLAGKCVVALQGRFH